MLCFTSTSLHHIAVSISCIDCVLWHLTPFVSYPYNQSTYKMQSVSIACPTLPSHKHRYVMVLNRKYGLLSYELSSCASLPLMCISLSNRGDKRIQRLGTWRHLV